MDPPEGAHPQGFSAYDNDVKPKGSASLAAIVSAFVPTWATGLIFLALFILIRHRYPKIYAPRTFVGSIPEKHRTPCGRRSYFDWVNTMRHLPDKFILYHHSLDTYLFMRFLRTIIFICVVGALFTWPILMPVNATGGGDSTQLDRINIGNVKRKDFYYAHAVMAWLFLGFVVFTVGRERLWLIGLRQAWSLSEGNAKRLSSRTVLFLSAPEDALQESNMHRFFGEKATRIWPVTEANALEALVAKRNSKIEQLEAAEMSLIRRARRKATKAKAANDGGENGNESEYANLPDATKKSLRPRHFPNRPPAMKKVDTIEWLRDDVNEVETTLGQARASHKANESSGGAAAVFVEFESFPDAQRACQQVSTTELLGLTPRYHGVTPSEVNWDNITLPTARRISQEGVALGMVIALTIFWSIPSGFIGLVSNVSYLAENFSWLEWLKRLPDPVIGILSGLLPPLLTSYLSKYVPNMFRNIFTKSGGATSVAIELKVQKWYYVFQITQVFLVTAVFSSAATVASQLVHRAKDPLSVPELLATQLPKASNFYLTYFIIQGTTSAADNLLKYSDLVQWRFYDRFFDRTPRQKFNRFNSMKGMPWGKLFPKFANFAIIAISYACIAPLVLGFAAAGVGLYYFSYKYNLLFTIQAKTDTRGQAYTLALQHILTGVYISELALIGYFGMRSAFGPFVMIIVLLALTILVNGLMDRYFRPLEKFLPTELAVAYENTTNSNGNGNGCDQAADETTALLADAEEGELRDDSRIHSLGERINASDRLVNPLARFFEPHVFASCRAMKTWINDRGFYATDYEDVPQYSEDDVHKAYLNPALTSNTPVIWLARDEAGASKNEIRENADAGLKASDEGAWFDARWGWLQWSEQDFSQVPIWKEKVIY